MSNTINTIDKTDKERSHKSNKSKVGKSNKSNKSKVSKSNKSSNPKERPIFAKSTSLYVSNSSNITKEGYYTEQFEQRFYNDFARSNVTILDLSRQYQIKLVDGIRIIRKLGNYQNGI